MLIAKPNHSDLLREAKALHLLGRLSEAQQVYQKILGEDEANPDALHFLGLIKHQQGDQAAAAERMFRSIALNPNSAEFHSNLGAVLSRAGRLEEAMGVLERAIQLRPQYPEAYDNMGIVLEKQGKTDQAIIAWTKAVEFQPDFVPALTRLAKALVATDRFDEGLERVRKAIELTRDNGDLQNQLGCELRKLGKLEEAVVVFRRAAQLEPSAAEPLSNRGFTLYELGQFDEALIHLEKAVELKPDYVDAHLNLSLGLLVVGNWERGWLEYEWRRYTQIKQKKLHSFVQPEWNGCGIEGRTILLTCEQGLGDTLQFIRYAPLVAQRGASVIVEAQPALCEILRGVKGIAQIVPQGAQLPPFDTHVRLMSLPGILGTRVDNVPADVPYLNADPMREAVWKPRLSGPGFKIGIAWQGDRLSPNDRLRSVPLKYFEPLAAIEGVRFLSLQKGFGSEQIRQVAEKFKVEEFDPALDDGGAGAFMDTAAVMSHLDLVITSDTAIAHLAGALGRRVWLALSYANEWRWLRDREDTPWYPTMRLFRQQKLRDWEAVFARMANALREMLSAPSTKASQSILAPMSPGELIDRITILQIKTQRLADPLRVALVNAELEAMSQLRDKTLPHNEQLNELARELYAVNESLWQAEDDIRCADVDGDFGPRFVELARSIYQTNDRRSALKNQINTLLGSAVQDEKCYRRESPSKVFIS